MQNGIYVALSSQIALERRLNTIADNVANASTVGFRATGIKFADIVSGTGQKAVSFSSTGDSYLSTQSGGLKQTGNSFDFAIKGDAWFGIETPSGTVMTRDGRFTMLDTGQLVTLEGHAVLDPGGAPLQLDPNAGRRRPARTARCARTGSRSVRSASMTSSQAPTSSAMETRASSPRPRPIRWWTAATSVSCRAMSRNRTSIRCSK